VSPSPLLNILPSPSSYKPPLLGALMKKEPGSILSPYNLLGIDITPILSVLNVFWGFKVVSS